MSEAVGVEEVKQAQECICGEIHCGTNRFVIIDLKSLV